MSAESRMSQDLTITRSRLTEELDDLGHHVRTTATAATIGLIIPRTGREMAAPGNKTGTVVVNAVAILPAGTDIAETDLITDESGTAFEAVWVRTVGVMPNDHIEADLTAAGGATVGPGGPMVGGAGS